MSLEVREFDVKRAKTELKSCPKIVRDYVKLLENHNEKWKELANKAISKLKKQSTQDKN